MTERRPPHFYQSYLLRLWREDEAMPWRAALQDARTGRQHAFADLQQLIAFLEQGPGEPGPTAQGPVSE